MPKMQELRNMANQGWVPQDMHVVFDEAAQECVLAAPKVRRVLLTQALPNGMTTKHLSGPALFMRSPPENDRSL